MPLIKGAGGGAIVTLSSSAGRFGCAYRTPYAAANWGVIGFTQSLAKELGPANIRVKAILPRIIKGPRMEDVIRDRAGQVGVPDDTIERRYLDRISPRRMRDPEDVAAMVVFRVSPAGRNLSDRSLGVAGNVETL